MIDQPPTAYDTSSKARTWDMLCHLSALAGYLLPLGNIIGPVLVWQLKKNEFPSVDEHGKEAVNFQISVSIYFLVGLLLSLVLIGIPLLFAIGIGSLVLIIIASIKANNGEFYRYPLTIRFIK